MLDILMILKDRHNLDSRWDDDWRHKYANGLDQFVRLNTAGDGVEPSPDGDSNFRDHNAWGDISSCYTRHSMTGIRGGEHVRLGHKFECGFLESNYYSPVRYAPHEIEVTPVSDKFAPIIQPVPTATATAQGGDRAGHYFSEGDTSTLWALNSLILRAEVVSLDLQVNNSTTRHLLEGGSLKIVYPMYHTLSQTFNTNGTEMNMNVVKSSVKLNGMFITLYRTQRGAHLTMVKKTVNM